MTFEKFSALQKRDPKKILVYIYYTESNCGWCTRLEKEVLSARDFYLTAHIYNYHTLALDASSPMTYELLGNEFKPNKNKNDFKHHELAYSLSGGKTGFPQLVFLNEKFERIGVLTGEYNKEKIEKYMRFASAEEYKKMTFEEYLKNN